MSNGSITLEQAIAFAAAAHAGQVDKAGQPYVLHVLRVMLRVEGYERQLAALGHDLLDIHRPRHGKRSAWRGLPVQRDR